MLPDCISCKVCSKCGDVHPRTADYFAKDKRAKDGLHSECRICLYKSVDRWRRDNPDKTKIYTDNWRDNNPEHISEYGSRWSKENPEKVRIRNHNRRSRIAKLPYTLTEAEWEDIKAFYDYACAYCGRKWYEIKGVLEQDHVIPLTKGGGYTKENIVPACKSCNCRKRNKILEKGKVALIK